MSEERFTESKIIKWMREDVKDYVCDTIDWVRSLFIERRPKYKKAEKWLDDAADKYWRHDKCDDKAHREARDNVKKIGLEEAIYSGLAGERPVLIRDWSGPYKDESGHRLLVVALTCTRAVLWDANLGDRDCGGRVRMAIKERLLEDVLVWEGWYEHPARFGMALIERARNEPVNQITAPEWFGYAEEFRRIALNLRKRADFMRFTLPKIAVAIALLAAVGVWLARYLGKVDWEHVIWPRCR